MGGKTPSTTTNITQAPKYLQPYLEQAAAQSQALYDKGGTPLYTGPTVVGQNQAQTEALTNMMQKAGYGATAPQVIPQIAPAPARPQNMDALDAIYFDELGRTTDPEGRKWYSDALAEGVSLDEIRRDIRGSKEAQDNLRNRGPSPGIANLPAGMDPAAGQSVLAQPWTPATPTAPSAVPDASMQNPTDPAEIQRRLAAIQARNEAQGRATQVIPTGGQQATPAAAPAATPAPAAVQSMPGLIGQTHQTFSDILSRPQNVADDPIIAAAADAATAPVFRQLEEEVLPGISRGATGAGQLGSSRQGIAEGLATGRAAQTAQETRADLYARYLGEAQRSQLQAMGAGGQMANLSTAPDRLALDIGNQRQAYEQSLMDEQRRRFQEFAGKPQADLSQYLSNLTAQTGISGAGGTSQTGGQRGPSTAGRLAGGALSGLGTYAMLGMNPVTAPFAMAGGLLAGASSFL